MGIAHLATARAARPTTWATTGASPRATTGCTCSRHAATRARPAAKYRRRWSMAALTRPRGERARAGRSTSTTRKARCPARICHSGLILAPTVWATPMMMPPASVPQKLPKPADDHGLEGVEQACRSDGGVEVGAHAEIECGHRDHHHGHRHREGEDAPVVDAHQLGDLGIVGRGAEGATELGAIEQGS